MNDRVKYRMPSDFFEDESFIEWKLFRSEEMDKYWEKFINEHPQYEPLVREASEIFEKAVLLNKNYLPEEIEKGMYNEIMERINTYNQQKKKQKIIFWLSAAACVLVVVASFWLTFQKKQSLNTMKNEIVGKVIPEEEIQLVSENRVLKLKQNTAILLDSKGQISLKDSLNNTHSIELPSKKMNKLIVPYGKRTYLLLADGTEIWLNSGTVLEFPTKFEHNSREINVEGEIYLNVKKINEQPFIVHTKSIDIMVFGTQFNVMAYSDDNKEMIVLVEGKIKVNPRNKNKTFEILPNELLMIEENNISKTKIANVDEYICWKDGVLEFNETPLYEILKKIERYYNVAFNMNESVELLQKTCSGKLFLSSSIDSVMMTISDMSSTIYTRENKGITIKRK